MIIKDLSNSFNPVPKNKNIKQNNNDIIKKKSSKLTKLESKRFSIMTNDIKFCYICKKNKKEDWHEAIEGKNRKKSIEYGLVIPICRECHCMVTNNSKMQDELHKKAQKVFKKIYKNKDFLKIFGKNYL